jgi:hypothetical protein
MGTPRTFRRQAVWLLLSAVAVSAVARRPQPALTDAATLTTSQSDTPSIGMIEDYAEKLAFDPILGAADAQQLLVAGGRRFGWAKIEPRRDAVLLDATRLAEGQVVARISSESAYAPLGLGRGTNWWWIDQRGGGGRWRSIVYSKALNGRKITLLDALISHPGYTWSQSIARFVVVDTIVMMWHSFKSGCIPSGPLPLAYLRLERADPWGTGRQK